MPRVSVIIPTYNRAHYIGAAIESVLAQTYRDYEILVVDDGSTDATESVLQAYAEHIRYLRQPHSGLPAVGRNAGLRSAVGEYIAFLDSDDLYMPDRLARHIERLDRQPHLALVYSDAQYFMDDGREEGTYLGGLPAFEGWSFGPLLVHNFIHTGTVTLRTACLARVGLFDEGRAFAEDWDLWLRFAAEYEIGFVSGMLCRVRMHPHSISGGKEANLSMHLAILKRLDRIARLYPQWVQPLRVIWREKRALQRLAAARAYARSRQWLASLQQFFLGIAEYPNLGWLLYLATTPRPAQRWLERRLGAWPPVVRHP